LACALRERFSVALHLIEHEAERCNFPQERGFTPRPGGQ
jgi:hypothetical protein